MMLVTTLEGGSGTVIERLAPGVLLLGRYRPCDCSSYLLHHGAEAAILEMPPVRGELRPPWYAARRVAGRLGLRVKALVVSHAHGDHVAAYPLWRRAFPSAPLHLHGSFRGAMALDHLAWTFDEPVKELSLGGEPLLLVHAPKHSAQDTLVFFRGTVCTGDWSLGAAPDCNALVPTAQKMRTLRFVRGLLAERRYRVHTAFSAHGNELRRGVDFAALLDEMLAYFAPAVRSRPSAAAA